MMASPAGATSCHLRAYRHHSEPVIFLIGLPATFLATRSATCSIRGYNNRLQQ